MPKHVNHHFYLLLGILLCIGVQMDMTAQFQDKALDYGIDHLYVGSGFGAGVSLVDINGDGLDDITLATGLDESLEAYLQTPSGFTPYLEPTFTAITDPVRCISWVDFDNDGDKDLFLTIIDIQVGFSMGSLKLYRREGDGSFEDITDPSGLAEVTVVSYGASWSDVDHDGYLDLHVNHYQSGPNGGSYLFKNHGDGTFTDITAVHSLADTQGISFTSVFFDADSDEDLELFVANDRIGSENRYYDKDGTGTYVNVSSQMNMNKDMESMGVDIADYDMDGDLDLYVTNTYATNPDNLKGNVLFKNNGSEGFQAMPNFPFSVDYGTFWGCSWVDLDNDMDQDMFTVCGFRQANTPVRQCFINDGSGSFTDYPGQELHSTLGVSYGSASGDVNNDGWPDIVVLNMYQGKSQVWESTPGPNNWVKLHLEGTQSNRDAIGSKVFVYTSGELQVDQKTSGRSYASQDSDDLLFGIAQFSKVDSVIIRWPNGHVNKVENLIAGGRYVIYEDVSQIWVEPGQGICQAFETPPTDLTKSFAPVNGVQDRLQLKWYKASPYIVYTDEDAAACDIRFWPVRDLDPSTGEPIGEVIQEPDTIQLLNVMKTYPDGSPKSIFKWPVKFYADNANNARRALPNVRYKWQVRCACEQGLGLESPWSDIRIFNTPDFDMQTGIYTPPGDIVPFIQSVQVHPKDPSRLIVRYTIPGPLDLEVLDINGDPISVIIDQFEYGAVITAVENWSGTVRLTTSAGLYVSEWDLAD